jgi:hypothetical protein
LKENPFPVAAMSSAPPEGDLPLSLPPGASSERGIMVENIPAGENVMGIVSFHEFNADPPLACDKETSRSFEKL